MLINLTRKFRETSNSGFENPINVHEYTPSQLNVITWMLRSPLCQPSTLLQVQSPRLLHVPWCNSSLQTDDSKIIHVPDSYMAQNVVKYRSYKKTRQHTLNIHQTLANRRKWHRLLENCQHWHFQPFSDTLLSFLCYEHVCML